MQKGKIIDLNYRNPGNTSTKGADSSISEELQKAIQNLIHRLRELGPLKS
jgi:hypothetical protein